MSVGNIGRSRGATAPASVKAESGHEYVWTRNGKTYVQINEGVSNNWVEQGSSGHVEFLNDLQDVNTGPLYQVGDVLTWTGSDWINQALPASSVDTFVAQSLFVSARGTSVAGGAERENLTTHFNNITEALQAAVSGDTIYCYGSHTATVNLAKAGVKWVFSGKGTISTVTELFWDENGAIPEIYVRGDAYFNVLNNGRHAVFIQGADTHYDIECYKILGRGSKVCRFLGGQPHSRLKVETTIIANLVNWCVVAGTNAKGTVEVGDYIDNQAVAGGIRTTLYVDGGALINTFYIIGDIKQNASTAQSTVVNISDAGGGFHITGDIYTNTSGQKTYFWGEGGVMCAGNITIIGDIYDHSFGCFWAYGSGCNINHTGNIYTSSPERIVAARSGSNNLGNISIKGDIYNAGGAAALLIRGINGAALTGTFRHDGKIYNTTSAAFGAIAALQLTAPGTGYPGQLTQSNITTTGGTGTGLILRTTKGGTGTGALSLVEIQDPGTGYTVADVITISGAGNGDATVTVEATGKYGALLFDNGSFDAIFDKSIIVVEDTANAAGGLGAYPGNKDVVVLDKVISNIAAINVTNLVTGSSIYDDPQIQ